jgi:IPT/TIG domain
VRHMFRNLTLFAALAAVLSMFAVASSAAAAVTVKRISPATGPEISKITVTIKGTGFSTTPGATKINFGAEPASNVVCTTTKSCTAVTPAYSPAEAVNVTATVESSTSTNTVPFTFTTYSPPVVKIVAAKKGPQFSKKKLRDSYPGVFTFGNVYLNIENSTTEDQTFTGPTGSVTLEPGLEQGYNFPVNESTPYVFELTTTSPKKILTVATKTPK